MKTFFEFWSMIEQEAQADKPSWQSSDWEKRRREIAGMPKRTEDPVAYAPRRPKGFDPNRLDPGLRDLINDEFNHRIHEFAKIVSGMDSDEQVNKWVGRHNTKLPYSMEIGGKKVEVTPEMLSQECSDYVQMGNKFMGDHKSTGSLDFASLLFAKMGRDQEAFADIIGTGDPEFAKFIKSSGKGDSQKLSYTNYHPQLKVTHNIPLTNAFDTGALDKAIIVSIYLRNRGLDESSSERRWMGAFKWISKNVFAKIRSKQQKDSLDDDMGDTGRSRASQIPDFRPTAGGTSKFNRVSQLRDLLLELKRMIEWELPRILAYGGAEVVAQLGADNLKRHKMRTQDLAFRGICKKLSTKDEQSKLPKIGENEKYKKASGTNFILTMFDFIATEMINREPGVIEGLYEQTFLDYLNKKMTFLINGKIERLEEKERLGREPYSANSVQNVAKLFIMMLDKAEQNLAKASDDPAEKWGGIMQAMTTMPKSAMKDMTRQDVTSRYTSGTDADPPEERFWYKRWRDQQQNWRGPQGLPSGSGS